MAALISGQQYKTFTDIPCAPGHWLTGNLADIKNQPLHLFVYSLAKRFEGLARFRVLHKPMLVVANPNTVQALLKSRPEQFRRASKIETVFREMGIHGVFSAEREGWGRQRQLMNPAFRPSQIKEFFTLIQRHTDTLVQRVGAQLHGNPIQQQLMSYTVDITSTLAFGIDLNSLDEGDQTFQNHLNRIFPMLSYRLHAPFPYWQWFMLKRDKDLVESLHYVRNTVAGLIASAKQQITEKSAADPKFQAENLLQAMLLGTSERDQQFSEDELFANVITLLLAGEDTTANTLAWTIHYLASRPDLQDRAFAEIEQNYPPGGALNYADLDRFPFTFACAQEAMRLAPVAPHLLLEAYEDQLIEGYRVPKGVMIFAVLGAAGFSDLAFPNADQFMPERWLRLGDDDKKRFAGELMHFGYGARLCPGRQLSFVEMKTALIELLRHYSFKSTPGHRVTETLAFTVTPANLHVDITPRNPQGVAG